MRYCRAERLIDCPLTSPCALKVSDHPPSPTSSPGPSPLQKGGSGGEAKRGLGPTRHFEFEKSGEGPGTRSGRLFNFPSRLARGHKVTLLRDAMQFLCFYSFKGGKSAEQCLHIQMRCRISF